MSKKYIECEAAKEYLRHNSYSNPYFRSQACQQAVNVLDEVPAADVVEVKHGRWINERWEGLSSFSAECGLCGKRTLAYFHYSYCPNCGAKMDGGQEEV